MNKLKTTEQFIKEAKQTHGNKYDYSLVKYKHSQIKIKIICYKHGIFEQIPNSHLQGFNCPKCAKNKKLTTEQFIKEAKQTRGNKYDYSLVEYTGAHIKIKIICPEHGIFKQTPSNHINQNQKQSCPVCNNIKITKTTEQFIKEAKQTHGNKYDYSLVEYKGAHIKIKIICPEHGIFKQTPNSHINNNGCSKCSKNKKPTTEEFIKKSNKIHNNKYDYSLLNYINAHTKIMIICPEHGLFKQTPIDHTQGKGCYQCGIKRIRLKSLKRIQNNIKNNRQITPNFNKEACELFDKISEEKNIHIQHAMNGGEFHIKELGYWVDGYDKENNIVYEFDEKHHFSEKQQIKDKIRQQEITNLLECEFIRI